jgi:hypothetical protein
LEITKRIPLKKTIVSLLIGSMLFSACQKEPFVEVAAKQASCLSQTDDPSFRSYTCDSITAVSYAGKHCGFLPISSKSYWIYQDSLFDNGAFVRAQYDTLRFTAAYKSLSDNLLWFEPNIEVGLPSRLYSNGEGIYQMEKRMFTDCIWDVSKEFTSPNSDSETYLTHFDDNAAFGKAVKLTSSIKTPAGNFSDCILFEKDAKFFRKDQVYFKPGLGVVKYICEKAEMGSPFIKLQQISTLVKFYTE